MLRPLAHSIVAFSLAFTLWPAGVQAQHTGVALHVGSMGFGADLIISVDKHLGFRVGGNVFPFDIDIQSSDVTYSLSAPSPQFLAVIDLVPAGAFRISAGALFAQSDFEVVAQLTEAVEIGGAFYAPSDIGNLTGTFDTRTVSPYVGIGVGTAASDGVGFFADLGIAFHGRPLVTVVVDGPIALVPQFQQDLDQEVQAIQDDVDNVRVYPVLSLGIVIGFGR